MAKIQGADGGGQHHSHSSKQLPTLQKLVDFYEDALIDSSVCQQKVQMCFNLVSSICAAPPEQIQEIFSGVKRTKFELIKINKNLTADEKLQKTLVERNMADSFVQSIRVLFERYAGSPTINISTMLYRTLF
jgi:hypothetical protein